MKAICALVATASIAAAQESKPREIVLPTPVKVGSAALAARANRIVGACHDHAIRVWDLADLRLLRTIPVEGFATIDVFVISPDGRWLLIGDHEGNAAVWSTDTGEVHLKVRLPHYSGAAAFARDGARLAIAPMGDPIQVYDVASARKLYETAAVVGGSAALAFSRDGSWLAAADADTAVRVYDARTGMLRSQNRDFVLEPLAVEFTADGTQVIAGGGDKAVAFIDVASGKLMRKIESVNEPIMGLAVSEDGTSVAAMLMKAENMNEAAPVVVWKVTSGEKTREWQPPALLLSGGWSREGEIVGATATADAVHLWRLR
jgi:WD40 repeat protein